MAKSLYIHLPFCEAKCAYCDFNSFARSEHLIDAYLQAFATELQLLAAANRGEVLSTIYIGGGTPSVLAPGQLEFLFAAIRENFEFSCGSRDTSVNGSRVRDLSNIVESAELAPDFEYTIEVNPGTLTPAKVAAIKAGGVNRVSIGGQAFQDHLLAGLGRIHTAADIIDAVESLRAANLSNLSLDLMFGIPGQTLGDLAASLDQALELNLPHLSVYSLILEEGTTFGRLAAEGKLDLPTEAEELAMFELVMATLQDQDYRHYEISNYARPSYQSRHNETYWLNEEYLGAGAGAHGYLHGVRYENQPNLEKYISTLIGDYTPAGDEPTGDTYPDDELTAVSAATGSLEDLRISAHEPTLQESKENTMILGLRMLTGVSLASYRDRYGTDLTADYGQEIADLLAKGLIELTADKIRLIDRGLIYGNYVFAEFLK